MELLPGKVGMIAGLFYGLSFAGSEPERGAAGPAGRRNERGDRSTGCAPCCRCWGSLTWFPPDIEGKRARRWRVRHLPRRPA